MFWFQYKPLQASIVAVRYFRLMFDHGSKAILQYQPIKLTKKFTMWKRTGSAFDLRLVFDGIGAFGTTYHENGVS